MNHHFDLLIILIFRDVVHQLGLLMNLSISDLIRQYSTKFHHIQEHNSLEYLLPRGSGQCSTVIRNGILEKVKSWSSDI